MNPRYNTIDNTSPFSTALENDKVKIGLTSFPFGRSHTGNMNIGTLEILDCFDTLPNSRYDLNLDLLIKTRAPLKRRIFNGCRVYVDAWYNSWSDLWEAAQNHIDHGRSGLLDIPKPAFDGTISVGNVPKVDFFTPNSVANQLGIPVRKMVKYGTDSGTFTQHPIYSYLPVNVDSANSANVQSVQDFSIDVNALPFCMYQRIAIDKYYPKNLIQNNKDALPDNIEKQKISYGLSKLNLLDFQGGKLEVHTDSNLYDPNSKVYTLANDDGDSHNYVYLGLKRYGQKKGDYFTTSSPFADLIRGSIPEEELAIADLSIDWDDVFADNQNYTYDFPALKEIHPQGGEDIAYIGKAVYEDGVYKTDSTYIKAAFERAVITGDVKATVTANTIRKLLVANAIKERSARTNGDYTSFVAAMFGKKPEVHDISAKHIGSFYQDIVFSDVTQTSASTESSPLGRQAGQASSASNGNLGSFYSPDFGYIMIIARIVPDDFYNQGIPRWLGELGADNVYLPINNNLPPMAIKNKEIFVTNDASVNEDVFAYTEYGEDEKARDNYASGFVGLPHELAEEDSAFLMHKPFLSSPQFNSKFSLLVPDNVDMEVFSVTDEPPFVFNAVSNITKYEPRPYNTLPMDFGMKY